MTEQQDPSIPVPLPACPDCMSVRDRTVTLRMSCPVHGVLATWLASSDSLTIIENVTTVAQVQQQAAQAWSEAGEALSGLLERLGRELRRER